MTKALLEGFFLGISTGSLCLMTCTPVYLPYLMTSERKLTRSLLAVAEISAGRFISYLTFGAIAGLAGASISDVNRSLFGAIASILLSFYLLLTVLRTHKSDKKCHIPKLAAVSRSGLLLGILTGINFCPAFLIALSEAVNLGGVLSGILLFAGFFVGTTLYLIPLAFASLLTQIKKMKYIARILSLFVAAWFIYKGTTGLIEFFRQEELSDARIIDVIAPNSNIAILASQENMQYFVSLKDSTVNKINRKVVILTNAEPVPDSLFIKPYIFFIDNTVKLTGKLEKADHIMIEPGYNIPFMLDWLQRYTFRTEENFSWEFNTKKE